MYSYWKWLLKQSILLNSDDFQKSKKCIRIISTRLKVQYIQNKIILL